MKKLADFTEEEIRKLKPGAQLTVLVRETMGRSWRQKTGWYKKMKWMGRRNRPCELEYHLESTAFFCRSCEPGFTYGGVGVLVPDKCPFCGGNISKTIQGEVSISFIEKAVPEQTMIAVGQGKGIEVEYLVDIAIAIFGKRKGVRSDEKQSV